MMTEQRVIQLLGGKRAIGKQVERELDFDEEIRKGFQSLVFVRFKENTRFSNAVMSRVLGVSPRTIDRFHVVKVGERIKPAVSDRLYRVAKVVALAEDVFGSLLEAIEWLSAGQIGLGNRRPIELLETDAGTREVEEELLRIEHGFVA
jgi:putative toxin-antitoxin system antitoxin component (TIGR02293 family)